ncbi:unnamed protein product [Rhizopus stolonifer]
MPGETETSEIVTVSATSFKRITKVKTLVANIRWNEMLRPVLNEFVYTVNDIVTHTFAFLKFIFIKEFDKDKDFDLGKYVTKSFFQEVFLSLVERQFRGGSSGGSSTLSEKVRQIRSFIYTHKDEYLQQILYAPIKLTNAQQIALYEGTKIYTAYINNVSLHFGNRLLMLINRISKQKEKISDMTQKMKDLHFTEEDIRSSIKTHIRDICHQLKLAVSSKIIPALPATFLDEKGLEQPQQFLNIYPESHTFANNSIYYDVKANLQRHLRAFYFHAKICEEGKIKSFNCFPLRKSLIPCYITIDTKILNYHILKNKSFAAGQKFALWGKVAFLKSNTDLSVVDLECKAIKNQYSGVMNFKGTIETDDVGISVIK